MLSIENSPQAPFTAPIRRIARIALGALLAAATIIPGHAQQTVVANPDRITATIDDSRLVTLKGNIHPLANAQNDLGAAPVSQSLNHIKLVLQRSPAQQAALDAFLATLQVQGSPNYHKWLTPKEFGTLYGPSDSDMQKITGWLEGQGFTINRVANGRVTIDFSGSVAQVQSAFHTSIHNYRTASGVSFYANASDPQIPAAMSAVVAGVAHLNNISLKPTLARGTPGKFDNQEHRFVPIASASGQRGQYTVGNSTNGYNLFVVPGDAATIYDTPNSFNANFNSGTSYTGTGATIGIAGQSAIDPTLVQAYRTLFVGDNYAPVISNLDGVGDVSGDDGESYLDNEVAGGLAPGANLHFYTESAANGGVVGASEYAIDIDNTVDILSLSYGTCELFNGTAGNTEILNDWTQAASQGITVLVSAGDSGSAGCDDPDTEQYATGPLAVNGLASTPYNIAVGGTDFYALYPYPNGNNFSNYVNTSSPGSASTFYRTAKSYIPESTWNDSTYPNLTINQNILISQYGDTDNISAGSGGVSNCSMNTTTNNTVGTCTSGYLKPTWQTGTGVPNDQARDVPDVALLAGNGAYGATWAVCDGETTGVDSTGTLQGSANCIADSSGSFYVDGVGGTSTAAPAFAGIMALIVQKTGQRQGQADPIIYGLFNSTPSIFHDVTTGNNSVGCTPSAANAASCLENSQGFDFESGYNTFTGYDLATGLGSVDATLLVNDWTSAAGSLGVANVAATPSATSISTNEPLSFSVTVSPLTSGGVTPAGTVTATDGIYTSPAVTLSSGTATITIPAGSLTANAADTFTITYSPATEATYAKASAFVVVAITQPTIAVSGSSFAAVAPGASGTSTITVTPGGGFTGAVALSCAVTGPAGAISLPTCSFAPASVTITSVAATSTLTVATTSTTTAGAYTVAVSAAATGVTTATGSLALTVSGTTAPAIAVAGTTVNISSPGTSGTSTVTVTPSGGFTGAVALTCAVTGPTGAISVPTCSFTPASVTITAAAGTSVLTLATEPTTTTGNYTVAVSAAATGVATATGNVALAVTGTAAAQTLSLGTPTAATVSSPGQSATSTIAVTTNYSPATINFSCAVASAPSGANTTYNPGCTIAAVAIAAGTTTGTATANFTTTATNAALTYPKSNQKPENHWYTAAGGAALACVLLFGIPARRRGWKVMLALIVFLVGMGGMGGCGGGGNNNAGSSGTATGAYTYTVTATDSVTNTVTSTTSITVTVN